MKRSRFTDDQIAYALTQALQTLQEISELIVSSRWLCTIWPATPIPL